MTSSISGRADAGPGSTSSSPCHEAAGDSARRPGSRPSTSAPQAHAHGAAIGQPRRQLALGERRHQAAGHDHGHEVRQPLDVAQLVRAEEHGAAGPPADLDQLVERLQALGVERGRGLVEQQHLGGRHAGHGQAQPLHHAAGVGAHRARSGAVQRREREGAVHGIARRLAQAAVELDHLAAGQRVGKRHPLRQEGDRVGAPARRARSRRRRRARPRRRSGGSSPAAALIDVVLPEPFGPSSATTAPRGTSKVSASTTRRPP